MVQDLRQNILDKFKLWQQLRQPDFRQYVINISLYVGRQYYGWDTSTNRLVEIPKAKQWHSQSSINRIQPKCRSGMGRMTSNLPMGEVSPNSGDYEDEYGARAGTALLKWNHRDQKMQKKYRNGSLWAVVCGHAFFKDQWDINHGKDIALAYQEEPVMEPVLDEMGEPVMGEDGQPMMQEAVDEMSGQPAMQKAVGEDGQPIVTESRKEGRTVTSVVGPTQMYYDNTYSDWEDVIDCIERTYMPLDWIKENIPGCENITDEKSIGMDDAYQMMYQTIADNSTTSNRKGAPVLEYWCKATREYPKGLHVIIVNDEIKVEEEMPGLEGERLPYAHFRYIPIPGSIRGLGLPEVMYDNQMAYNKAWNQTLDNATLMLNKKYLKNKNTNMDDPDDTSGQVMEWDGPVPPQELKVEPLPQGHAQIMGMAKDNFDDLSMIHKISEGASSPELNSEDQVAAVTENDLKSGEAIVEEFLEAICTSCKNRLIYWQAFGPDEMILKIVGADGHVSLKPFRVSDIRNNTDVYINPASMLSVSRSARMKEIQAIAQSALVQFMQPVERTAFLGLVMKHLQWAENQQALNEATSEQSYAERENQKMANGEMAYVMPWDDNDIHIKIHLLRIKSAEFDDYPDQIKDMMKIHYDEHVKVKMEILQTAPSILGGAGPAPPNEKPGQGGQQGKPKPMGGGEQDEQGI